MERTSVHSSNIASIGYDAENKLLEVEFKGGGVYQYLDVPKEMHEQLLMAKSIGGFFSGAVRPRYKWVRIEQEKEKWPQKNESQSI